MPDLPNGIATFLFTDIEGSTKLWEEYPEVMPGALARHDLILRRAIEAKGGAVFKTGGDAFFALFAAAPRALEAALIAQRQLLAHNNGPMGPLCVRMALHSGEAVHREGDFFGSTVNRAARLLAAGHGQQILMTSATQELAGGALPPGLSLRDLGRRRLKDLSGAEHIFQVTMPGLPDNFPPLRTLDVRPTNLPAQLTSFIGREREVIAATRLLRQSAIRLLTLTGPGGAGKTRLSLQIAADLLDDFEDGVFFVTLGLIRDPTLVASTIAQALDVNQLIDQPMLTTLKAHLASKHLLLLLDNFEQITAAAPLISELLAAAPGLKVLASSRAGLDVYGEHNFSVPPLALPPLPLSPGAADLAEFAAVALFADRARAVKSDFVLTGQNAPAVAEICARLDGLPLAIELAAANSRLFTPEAMLARLTARPIELGGQLRGRPERQQSLRGAIDWSYELLTEAEKVLFTRLAVFAGGCTVEAAEAVCNGVGGLQLPVAEGLLSLLHKSMVRQMEGANGDLRFGLLSTIREYALERLVMRPEANDLRRQHSATYLALAEKAVAELSGPKQVIWLDRLELEHDNLRAALAWSLKASDGQIALGLSGALWRFWYTHGHINEGRRWLEEALAQGKHLPAALRANGLLGAGVLAYLQNDYARAVVFLEESLAIRSRLGDKLGIGNTLTSLGTVAEFQGDYGRAKTFYEESLTLFRQLQDRSGIARVLNNLAMIALNQDDHPKATALSKESLALSRHMGDRWSMAISLNNLGLAALQRKATQQAAQLFEESLVLCRELGDRWGIARLLNDLGMVAYHQERYEQAGALFAESLALRRDLGDKKGIASCLQGLAAVSTIQGRSERVTQLCAAIDRLRKAIGDVVARSGYTYFEKSLATARERLGEEGFAAAWAGGQALTLDEAVHIALAQP